MTGRVPYSSAQPGAFTAIPGTYVSQVMRLVEDTVELKTSLLLFYLLSASRDYPAYVTAEEFALKCSSLLGLQRDECSHGIDAAVERGVFLRAELHLDGADTTVFFANIESDLAAIEELKQRMRRGAGAEPMPAVQNIFQLYEQNIGIVSPLIADELRDAQRTYPAQWLEEAFREAARARKLNWKYVNRILERWQSEGRDSGTHRPGSGADDRDRYVKGRFGHLVKR